MRVPVSTDALMDRLHRHFEEQHRIAALSAARVATGTRINTAMDDASGLAIATRLHASHEGLAQAARNAQDGISMLAVAEGALSETGDLLQRMRVLALQSANGVYDDNQRGFLDRTFAQAVAEIEASAARTRQVGGSMAESHRAWIFQVGAQAGQSLQVEQPDATASALRVDAVEIGTQAGAASAMDVLDEALARLFEERARVAAAVNRLQSIAQSLGVAQEHTHAAASRITDTDVAQEAATLAKARLVAEAGVQALTTAVRAQAIVLDLFRPLDRARAERAHADHASPQAARRAPTGEGGAAAAPAATRLHGGGPETSAWPSALSMARASQSAARPVDALDAAASTAGGEDTAAAHAAAGRRGEDRPAEAAPPAPDGTPPPGAGIGV